MDEDREPPDGDGTADELLRRALIDPEASVGGRAARRGPGAVRHAHRRLPRPRATWGRSRPTSPTAPRGAGHARSAPTSCCACPCDLDLGDAEDRDEAEEAYAEQARTLRDALAGRRHRARHLARAAAASCAESPVGVDRSVALDVRLPAHRLHAGRARRAREGDSPSPPVCGARTLAEGRPPMGIACAQQDVAHVYPLPDDPERCLEDFVDARRRPRAAHGRAPRRTRRPRSGASWSSTATIPRRRGAAATTSFRRRAAPPDRPARPSRGEPLPRRRARPRALADDREPRARRGLRAAARPGPRRRDRRCSRASTAAVRRALPGAGRRQRAPPAHGPGDVKILAYSSGDRLRARRRDRPDARGVDDRRSPAARRAVRRGAAHRQRADRSRHRPAPPERPDRSQGSC